MYLNRQKVSKAEELLKRAAALDPKKTDYRVRLAYIFLETGRESKAAEVCKELIELEPNNAAPSRAPGFRLRPHEAIRRTPGSCAAGLGAARTIRSCREFHEQMDRAPRMRRGLSTLAAAWRTPGGDRRGPADGPDPCRGRRRVPHQVSRRDRGDAASISSTRTAAAAGSTSSRR